MTKASNKEEYRNLPDERIKEISSVLKELPYTETELTKRVCPHIAQWLYNKGVAIESTCLLISEVINLNNIENEIKRIYEGNYPPMAKSSLNKFLTKEEYKKLEQVIEFKDYNKIFTGDIDDSNYLTINYPLKQVIQSKRTNKKDGDDKHIPVLEAVPKELIVYDSAITDQPRSFKITWTSRYSKRDFKVAGEGNGADIEEISNYMIKSGFSHNPKLVSGAMSCMINTLIDNGFADIKTDIDNKGVYFSQQNEKIIVVDLDTTEPTIDEMHKAIDVLNTLMTFYMDNLDTFASVFKWGLMTVFSYAMKQIGNELPYLYLTGSSRSGKTTLGRIVLYLYGVRSKENDIGGSSFNTEYRIGLNISNDCTARLVNEPASLFNHDGAKEMLKNCVESITARRIQGKVYPAFSPVIFTANQYVPNDDALLNRFYVLSFSYSQVKTEEEKKKFKDTFHIKTPSISILTALNTFGKFAIREIQADPSRLYDDWQKTADFLINKFYAVAQIPCPKWLGDWAESEGIEDYDVNQIETIRNFFLTEFNRARSKVTIKNEYGNVESTTLDIDEASTSEDFIDVNWKIVNSRMIPWAIPHTSRWNDNNICLTYTLKNELDKFMDYDNSLKSVSELLGWKYGTVKVNGSSVRVIKVNFEDFMSFMYPSIGEIDEEGAE